MAKRIYLGCVIIGLLFLGALSAFKSPSYLLGLANTNEDYFKSSDYSSDIYRLNLLINQARNFMNTYGIGLGPAQSQTVEATRIVPVHFFYFEILVEYGVVIAGYFLWNMFRFGCNNIRLKSRLADAIMNSAFFVLLVGGVSSSKMILIRPTWVVITLLFCLEYGDFDNQEETMKEIKADV